MTKVSSWLAGVGLAALVGVMLFGAAGIYGASEVEAQSPPDPPARFVGTVTVDGEPAEAGATVEARIGDASCGTAAVFIDNGAARYSVDVVSASATNPNCGSSGATVSFYVDGAAAAETGEWINFDLNQLNLTVSSAVPTPTTPPVDDDDDDVVPPTATPVPSDDDDADADDNGVPAPTATPGAPAATPGPPATGTGTGTGAGSFSAVWLLAAVGLGAAAFGAAGTVAARRK